MSMLNIPPVIQEALDRGATLVLSISGGKDSDAMTSALLPIIKRHRYPAMLAHADLGRAEWPETAPYVDAKAEQTGLMLAVVRRTKGDLIDRIEDRLETLSHDGTKPAKPFWPSAQQRYCTSDLKRGPLHRVIRKVDSQIVISVQGLRREESPARRKKPTVAIDRGPTTKRLKKLSPRKALDAFDPERDTRLVLAWYPILEWTVEDVWHELGTSVAELEHRQELYKDGQTEEALDGWDHHPAYVYGNRRLSCVFCVLGCRSDLENGARHNPELLSHLIHLEQKSGYTFKADLSLETMAREMHLDLPILNQ